MEDGSPWEQFGRGETPSTVELDPVFYERVPLNFRVLDFGCAGGRISFQLQNKGYTVFGFDINQKEIASALERAEKSNQQHQNQVNFQVADGLELPFEEAGFDACVLQAVLTTLVDPEHRKRVLNEVFRVLKKDGVIYLADYGMNWENPRYRERYLEDFPETGEMGTFIVTEDGSSNTPEIFRAHHYQEQELKNLIGHRFKIEFFKETVFTTFHGNQTRGYIIVARK
jgi:ubiquinone/menaquinone biosynthesis C-methylase UbiE